MTMNEKDLLSVTKLIEGFAKKSISPVDLMEISIERARKYKEDLNSLYELDETRAMRCAEISAKRWKEGRAVGVLEGIPTTSKDALLLTGFKSYRGCLAGDPDPNPAHEDAPVNSRIKREGAIFIGKSMMCDLGIIPSGYSSKHGITRNPWNLSTTPGGSSSGAAASVAAGITPFAIGTDIVGSIRLPAAFTGIYGFKPSQGRVPYYPQNSPALVAGPLTHTVEDAALLMNVITGPDSKDYSSIPFENINYVAELKKPMAIGRIGLVRDLGFKEKPSSECMAAVEMTAGMLKERGWTVVDIEAQFTDEDLEASEKFYKIRAEVELKKAGARRGFAEKLNKWVADVAQASAVDLYEWYLIQQRCRMKATQMIKGFDFILTPATLTASLDAEFPGVNDNLFTPWSQTFLFNLSEQPAASIPMLITKSGSPTAVQIVGRRHDDVGVLKLSKQIEEMRGDFPLSPYARRVH